MIFAPIHLWLFAGEGLGKKSDGIIKPIKANLKFDSAGLGHDRAAEFTNHWWENAYNAAASNLEVGKTDANEVAINLQSGESIEISAKGYTAKSLREEKEKKSSGYGSFVKKSTLYQNVGIDKEGLKSDSDDAVAGPSNGYVRNMSDNDLFKACGGRTAHK